VDVDGRIIIGGIFGKWEGVVGTGWSGLRIGTVGGHSMGSHYVYSAGPYRQ
jgi:hypothetical protein